MPLEQDIGTIYQDYFTHETVPQPGTSWAQRIYHRSVARYVAEKYGYGRPDRTAFWSRMRGWLVYLWPSHIPQIDVKVMYLQRKTGGRLLDVGCGNGWTMEALQKLGWQCEGVDFDPLAVRAAQSRGLTVRLGPPEAQAYADDTFDAVIMSHVIEHVPHPLEFLVECCRILKPGGSLTVLTPNASSLGHKVFKESWLYLDPPRHLHVFTPQSLGKLITLLGRMRLRILTTVRGTCWMVQGSRSIRATGRFAADSRLSRVQRLTGEASEMLEWCGLRLNPSVGEEIVVLAEKD